MILTNLKKSLSYMYISKVMCWLYKIVFLFFIFLFFFCNRDSFKVIQPQSARETSTIKYSELSSLISFFNCSLIVYLLKKTYL